MTPGPAAETQPGVALPRRLNLGCGRDQRYDCLNLDIVGSPDLLWNLDEHPYPLPRKHFEHVYALDVVEHLQDIKAFVEEVHALLMPGGILEITTPHFSCYNSFVDPTHRHHLSYFSFDYFTTGHKWSFYSKARFVIVERQIVFHPGPLSRWLAWFAGRRPDLYERRFAWLFPAWFLTFRLRAVDGDD